MKTNLVQGLNESAKEIHAINKAKGFWDKEKNIGELLMLVTSELGEALEADRKNKHADLENFELNVGKTEELRNNLGKIVSKDNYAVHFKTFVKDTFEDEIADAVIRLLDLSAGLGIDIEKHINA